MDERMRYDGRRLPPRNSRGEFRRRRRGDRGMDYEGDMQYRRSGGRSRMEHHRQGGYDNRDMRYDYGHGESREYYPIEAMGVFNGYYGMGDGDYRHGGGRYGYDMRGRGGYDYGYDYGYDDYGDFGEVLTEEDLEHWNKRLMHELDDREKQMFHKDTVMQRAKAMGQKMQGFGEKSVAKALLIA